MLQDQPFRTSIGYIRIELAQSSDLETVLDILEEAACWITSLGIDQWQPGDFRDNSARRERITHNISRGEIYLAFLDAQVIGTFTLHCGEKVDKTIWSGVSNLEEALYLHRLAIRRAFAGQGLGRDLLQWAEKMVAAKNKKYLRLDCMAENQPLCAYYEQAGFTYRGEVQGKGWAAKLYERKI